jgi:integrase
VRRTVKGCSDKIASEAIARKLETDADLRRRGVIDVEDDLFSKQEARPLTSHLEDFHAHLKASGTTRKHAHMVRAHVARIMDRAHLTLISKISPSGVQAAIKSLRDQGLSPQTCNHSLRAIKEFTAWLVKDGRARKNTISCLKCLEVAIDRRRERRSFSELELENLIRTAASGPVVLGMSGPDRAVLYRLAAGTGFRANELRSLYPESFDLESERPSVTVQAAYSKRRRNDEQVIRPDLAAALRVWLARKDPGCPVFDLPGRTAQMMRRDMASAGIAYKDDYGRVLDFHSLRHTFITMLSRSRAPVKVVQELARHSDPRLTLNVYSHLTVFDKAAALDALPGLSEENHGPQEARKSGTDDIALTQDGSAWVARSVREGSRRDGLGRDNEPIASSNTPPEVVDGDGVIRLGAGKDGIQPTGPEPVLIGVRNRSAQDCFAV